MSFVKSSCTLYISYGCPGPISFVYIGPVCSLEGVIGPIKAVIGPNLNKNLMRCYDIFLNIVQWDDRLTSPRGYIGQEC